MKKGWAKAGGPRCRRGGYRVVAGYPGLSGVVGTGVGTMVGVYQGYTGLPDTGVRTLAWPT